MIYIITKRQIKTSFRTVEKPTTEMKYPEEGGGERTKQEENTMAYSGKIWGS